ncbi:MAG: alpha/beta hydrolase, partial [Paludibacteraceae bacterium]|nr:alpha/beta hydrolase [Paludibacteraceae bacterium]
SADDPVVDYRNSLVLDRVLTARHLPHLFATYPTGGHGYGMKDTPFTRSSGWQERLWSWLVATGMGR